MYCPERPAANLLLHQILVDAMFGGAIILAVAVLGSCIERFLQQPRQSRLAEGSQEKGMLVGSHLYVVSRGGGCSSLVS
jgi:hypothetical protein